jgi:hypothetical protein
VNLPARQFQYTCFVDSGGKIYADRHTALVVFRRVNGICHRGLASPHANIVHRIRSGKRIVVVRQGTPETSRTCERSRCGAAPRRARRRARKAQCRRWAPLRHADGLRECLLIGAQRSVRTTRLTSRASATSKVLQPRCLQSVQIRPLQLPHSDRWGGHAAARVQPWPAGDQFRRMGPSA